MNQIWAPAELPFATRGEFLAARATAVRELERRILSPTQVLLHGGLVCAASIACSFVGGVLAERSSRTVVLMVFAAVLTAGGVAAVVPTVRRAVRNRKLTSELLAWETAERPARNLPPGQVRPDLRTPFDARQDADFEQVAGLADAAAYNRVTAGRLMFRLFPPSCGLVFGFVLLMGVFTDAPVAERVSWGVAGGYMLVCCVVAVAATMKLSWRVWMLWRAQKTEITAWRTERIGQVAAAQVDRAWWWQRASIGAPFVAMFVLWLAARVITSSPAAAVIAVCVVGLAGTVTLVVLLFRSHRRAAAPAEHDLTAVPPG